MRNFLRTAEPRGRKAITGKQRLRYYVQRHHARRPHYDFKARRSGAKVPQKPKSRKR